MSPEDPPMNQPTNDFDPYDDSEPPPDEDSSGDQAERQDDYDYPNPTNKKPTSQKRDAETCSQCGQPLGAPACGPTHATITAAIPAPDTSASEETR